MKWKEKFTWFSCCIPKPQNKTWSSLVHSDIIHIINNIQLCNLFSVKVQLSRFWPWGLLENLKGQAASWRPMFWIQSTTMLSHALNISCAVQPNHLKKERLWHKCKPNKLKHNAAHHHWTHNFTVKHGSGSIMWWEVGQGWWDDGWS